MKSLRLLFFLALFLITSTGYSQNVTLQVSGHVFDQQTGLPVAQHMVAVTVFPDSANTSTPYTDSTFTDPSGLYNLSFQVTFTPGVANLFSVGTFDCMWNWNQHVLVYSGNQSAFTADFSICTDTIPPPSSCENYITFTEIQDLTVWLQGSLLNGQQASYYWNMGDGSATTGQNITHTYAQQGIYTVTLQTVTTDSCIDYSEYTVMLMDTIDPPSPCANYISINDVQGLTVTLQGSMVNGQAASYFWDLGDNTTSTGQNVTHTYSQQGIYYITLQTITNDSCLYSSSFPIVLMDSIPNGCDGYFVAMPTGNEFELSFQGYSQSQYPTVYTWEFGDGTSATGQSLLHTYCCAGTYTVALIISDSTGCTSTYVAPILVLPDSTGNMVISGQVIAGNSFLNQGMVSLFGTDQYGNYYPAQTTYIDSLGLYNFWNVGTGTYLILAFPQPDSLPGAQQYLPTFYGDVIFWEQATPINLGVPLNPYNINLVSFDSIGGGDGSVNGQILGGGKSMLAAGIEVLLLDALGNPVRITYTDTQGMFSFGSLPFGEYQVNPVITGILAEPVEVVLDETNSTASVTMTINGNTITGVMEKGQVNLITKLYPNPAADYISINVSCQGTFQLFILDASGKIILAKTEAVQTGGSILTIPVDGFKPGLYTIRILDENRNASTKRFIKN